MSGYDEGRGVRLRRPMPGYRCPYCAAPVGYVGRLLAWLFGTRIHGCDSSNVKGPGEQ